LQAIGSGSSFLTACPLPRPNNLHPQKSPQFRELFFVAAPHLHIVRLVSNPGGHQLGPAAGAFQVLAAVDHDQAAGNVAGQGGGEEAGGVADERKMGSE